MSVTKVLRLCHIIPVCDPSSIMRIVRVPSLNVSPDLAGTNSAGTFGCGLMLSMLGETLLYEERESIGRG